MNPCLNDPVTSRDEKALIVVQAPTLTTQNTLTVDLSKYGMIKADWAGGGAEVLVGRTAGDVPIVGAALPTAVVNASGNLVLTEGAAGFTTGDLYVVAFAKAKALDVALAVAS